MLELISVTSRAVQPALLRSSTVALHLRHGAKAACVSFPARIYKCMQRLQDHNSLAVHTGEDTSHTAHGTPPEFPGILAHASCCRRSTEAHT